MKLASQNLCNFWIKWWARKILWGLAIIHALLGPDKIIIIFLFKQSTNEL